MFIHLELLLDVIVFTTVYLCVHGSSVDLCYKLLLEIFVDRKSILNRKCIVLVEDYKLYLMGF